MGAGISQEDAAKPIEAQEKHTTSISEKSDNGHTTQTPTQVKYPHDYEAGQTTHTPTHTPTQVKYPHAPEAGYTTHTPTQVKYPHDYEAGQTTQPPTHTPTQVKYPHAYEAGYTTHKPTQVKYPHAYEAILKNADTPIDTSSPDKLYEQLYAGVFLNNKRKRYWVEKNSLNNCFFLFARELNITWAEDSRYWHWPAFKETSDSFINIAELLNVCWLEIYGKFETAKLTPGIKYEVVFVVMIKDPAYGWETPVNVRLALPDGTKQEHRENLTEKPRGKWIEIPAGEFMVPADSMAGGFIEFCLYEYEGGAWKRGLVVKGVTIRPKH